MEKQIEDCITEEVKQYEHKLRLKKNIVRTMALFALGATLIKLII